MVIKVFILLKKQTDKDEPTRFPVYNRAKDVNFLGNLIELGGAGSIRLASGRDNKNK